MREILNGMHENARGDNPTSVRLYHNDKCEDYPDHWHVGIEVIMPVMNGYTVIAGEKNYELEPGEIIIINSGIIHALKAPKVGKRVIFQFDLALLYHLKEMETLLFMMPPALHVKKEDEVYPFLRERLGKVIQEYDAGRPFCEASIYAALIEMFVELGRRTAVEAISDNQMKSPKQQEYLKAVMNACSYINRHYMENLTLEEVAAVSGFSKFHFTRIFKQFMNMTFYEYLNSKRMRRAEELLYQNELSITDIAMNSGFSSLSAFNRTFKAVKHCSPRTYSRQCRSAAAEEHS